MSFVITPKVNPTQEFIEIADDFSNPLDLVREAISNAFDAGAKQIRLDFSVIDEYGEGLSKIEIEDNGAGMDEEGLQSFFDLGNSMRKKNDSNTIGEKGHGTKVYFNSKKIEVITRKNSVCLHATMEEPKKKLYNHTIPDVDVVTEEVRNGDNGTKIIIYAYNNNRTDRFNHEQLKDYILWFTKFGSVERCFKIEKNADVVLKLKGVDKDSYEDLTYGHFFPEESENAEKLLNTYKGDAENMYCKGIVREGSLKNKPEIKFQAVFYVEGKKVKYRYNKMLKHQGYAAPNGGYMVQDRYGIWLCKDYIPIQRKNEWITKKGSEYTRFHAFVNCQKLKLTANRGSVENTPTEILEGLREAVEEIYDEIIHGDDWQELLWLASETEGYTSVENEKKDFKSRLNKINRARVAQFTDSISGKTIRLVQPKQENGVFSMFMQLSTLNPDIFPFTIIDYDTHSGIDVIVKAKDTMPIKSSKLYYVEFKNHLTKEFNHSFENLHSIVCWDVSDLKHEDEITDIAGNRRMLKIVQREGDGDYTRYYLDSPRSDRKIEIFVLEDYLRDKFGVNFVPRTEADII